MERNSGTRDPWEEGQEAWLTSDHPSSRPFSTCDPRRTTLVPSPSPAPSPSITVASAVAILALCAREEALDVQGAHTGQALTISLPRNRSNLISRKTGIIKEEPHRWAMRSS
ncbi:hypothetical protein VTJ04DRAFT_3675 [Mycothermus thermophilus]|uniref:uncharacterized protein n=1 Tax=Humicola insolens TaxID=85995 RepID=UPI0037445DD2